MQQSSISNIAEYLLSLRHSIEKQDGRVQYCKCGRSYSSLYDLNRHFVSNMNFFTKWISSNQAIFNGVTLFAELVDTADRIIPPDNFKRKIFVEDGTATKKVKTSQETNSLTPLIHLSESSTTDVVPSTNSICSDSCLPSVDSSLCSNQSAISIRLVSSF